MLRLEGVTKRYGERLILRDIDFHAAAASLTYLAGANGAGKSTLLRIMGKGSEFHPFQHGRQCIFGEAPARGLAPEGQVFQGS